MEPGIIFLLNEELKNPRILKITGYRVVKPLVPNVLELRSSHFEVLVNSESSTIFDCRSNIRVSYGCPNFISIAGQKNTTRSKDGDKKWSGKTSGMEGSVEEAEERRRKRLERFNAEKLGATEERWCSYVTMFLLIGFSTSPWNM